MSQFGGCEKLASQYKVIAEALGEFERKSGHFSSVPPSALKSFRHSVSPLPVEVLESYLDDLLSLEITCSELFLPSDTFSNRISLFSLLGLVASVVCGVYAASTGATFFLSLGLTICLASPFAVLWHFSPRERTIRRMRYAQVLSHEISRRRGGGKGGRAVGTDLGVIQGAFGA